MKKTAVNTEIHSCDGCDIKTGIIIPKLLTKAEYCFSCMCSDMPFADYEQTIDDLPN